MGSTKQELLSKVWGHNKVLDTHTLESLIYRLRKKIEINPNQPKILILKEKKYFLIKISYFEKLLVEDLLCQYQNLR